MRAVDLPVGSSFATRRGDARRVMTSGVWCEFCCGSVTRMKCDEVACWKSIMPSSFLIALTDVLAYIVSSSVTSIYSVSIDCSTCAFPPCLVECIPFTD